jgi:hypothetical protein
MIYEPMVRLAQTLHLCCTDTNTISKRIEMRFHMTHVTKVLFEYVQNDIQAHGTFGANHAPILHRYTISKWSEMIFHMTHIT